MSNWREMTKDEIFENSEDIMLRQIRQQEEARENNRRRINEIASGKTVVSVAHLQRFINKLNSIARRFGCLQELPKGCYESREAFLVDALEVLRNHNVPEEEISKIIEINEDIKSTKV